MADRDDIVVLLDFGGTQAIERTRSSGKTQVSISISSTPLVHNFDPLSVGKGPVEAIRDAIRDQTLAIAETVSEATLERRARSAKEFAKGNPGALKRYSGGRTGATPPKPGATAWMNDSGRLANGLSVNANPRASSWEVKAPANRLRREDFKGDAFDRIVTKWVSLVPALRDPLSVPSVVDTHEKAFGAIITKRAMAAAERQRQLTDQFVMRVLSETAKLLAG